VLRDRRAADLAPGGQQAIRGAEEARLPRTGQRLNRAEQPAHPDRLRITPEGRQALAAWLHDPGDGPVIEFEQLVKVFFAENGT
jgi:PadR family transcriptional regulator, regulatory protein AphA